MTCISEGKIMNVFYKELDRFVGLRKSMADWAKRQIKKIDAILYNIVKSQYTNIINKGRRSPFAL